MTSTDNFAQLLDDWLADAAPQTMPATLHSGAIDRARRSRQRWPWVIALRGAATGQGVRGFPVSRAVGLAVLVAATVLIGIVFAAAIGQRPSPIESPTPTPSETYTPAPTPVVTPLVTPTLTEGFGRPFSYVLPAHSGMRALSTDSTRVIEFSDRPLEGRHGIVVAGVSTAVAHVCPGGGRAAIRKDPRGLLEDLETIGGFTLDAPSETTFDGRPALLSGHASNPDPNSCDSGDIHIDHGTETQWISLARDSSLIVSQVDGLTFLIEIWAVDDAELERWLPTAMEFVNTFHFISAS